MRRREVLALLVLALVLVVGAYAYFWVDEGFRTVPVERTEQQNTGQNTGVDAPSEQAPSPGTVEDSRGDAELPKQQ